MKNFLVVLVLWCAAAVGFGQEQLAPLGANASLKPAKQYTRFTKSFEKRHLRYQLDTLIDLPFKDDFSRNWVKQFNANPNNPNYQRVFRYNFTVSGIPYPFITYTFDTQYVYVAGPHGVDTAVMPTTEVVLYEPNFPYLPDTTLNVWLTGNDSDNVTTTLTNYSDTFVIVPDDNSLWVGGHVFINNSFGIGAPTYGVATFDGLDSVGLAHDFANSSSQGYADTLASKPLDFSLRSPADSIYLSFYYQPQGHGNRPENLDSLKLEFYDPAAGWVDIWAMPGTDVKAFEQVFIPIRDERWFYRGFRFRFRNRATLAGNLDHWNIDYVYLGTNRSASDEYISDSGWRYVPSSYISTYTSMPYAHYVHDPANAALGSFNVRVHNLDQPGNTANLSPARYQVFDANGNSIHGPVNTSGGGNPTQVQPGDTTFIFPMNGGPSPFTFPTTGGVREEWVVQSYYSSNNDEITYNDTLTHTQRFDTYYSLDDGTAEKGYGLIGVGAQMAQEFTLPPGLSDTLKAIQIYFPQMLEDVTENEFQVVVWTGESGPQSEVYRGFIQTPQYTEYGTLQRFEIFDEIILSGTFYVGIEQREADQIYVGFDENINNSDRIWYNTSEQWAQTSFTGSLLIRPDFGDEPIIAGVQAQRPEAVQAFEAWPNPLKTVLNVRTTQQVNDLQLTLTDLSGRMVWSAANVHQSAQLPGNLPAGMYVLRAYSPTAGALGTKRMMVVE